LGDLKLKNPNHALMGLAESAGSPAERTEFLKLYREYSKAGPKADYPFTMSAFAGNISSAGFEQGSRWMEESDLSKDEMKNLAGNIICNATNSEKGLWIEWMGKNFSGKDREQEIYNAMQSWTETDSRAAGEWLVKAPDNTAKTIAVATYARTVAPHDPKVAAQWAITLPPGEIRKSTLSNVYKKWLKDEAANTAERDAFMAANPAK
jgi:hypothetical protein